MEYGYRFLLILQKILAFILIPYYWWNSRIPKKIVPKIEDKILVYSATALSQKIRSKELSSAEVIQAYINRISVVNPVLNAVVEDRFEEALKEANNVDNFLKTDQLQQEELRIKFPLLGVPLTIKESCSLKGMSCSVGSKNRIGLKATSDGASIKRLRMAGAIPLLVSSTPELCLCWETTNLIQGKTCNPYDTNRTSAGSSGGEGALLGSGASVIGVGSDVAGSIRLPAMFNGIFGHKPTPRIISIEGHYPTSSDDILNDYLVIGPMVRYAEDLPLMMQIMCDEQISINLTKELTLEEINVYYMDEAEKSILLRPVHKDIKSALIVAVNYLKNTSGMTLKNYKFKLDNSCEMCLSIFYKMYDIPNVLRETSNKKNIKNAFLEILKALFGVSNYSLHGLFFYALQKTNVFVPRNKYEYYRTEANLLKRDFIDKLGDNGIFLYPTFPTSAFEHNKIFVEVASVMYTMLFNILGFPSTHVPLGRNSAGLPIGIQVVASPYQDRLCFAVAKELENCCGGWTEP